MDIIAKLYLKKFKGESPTVYGDMKWGYSEFYSFYDPLIKWIAANMHGQTYIKMCEIDEGGDAPHYTGLYIPFFREEDIVLFKLNYGFEINHTENRWELCQH